MTLLNGPVVDQVRQALQGMQQPVEMLFFGRKQDCPYCDETRQLAEELTTLSDLLRLTLYDLDEQPELAGQYHVDRAPTLVLAARAGDRLTDHGIRFVGIPSGHEFMALIQSLLLVSGRDSQLQPQTRTFLKELKDPILLQVFVTPT